MNNELPLELRTVLTYAREEAIRLGSYVITTDHLFLGILRAAPNEVTTMISLLGGDLVLLKRKIESNITYANPIPFEQSAKVTISDEVKSVFAFAFKRIVATGETPQLKHILLSILSSGTSFTSHALKEQNITLEVIASKIAGSAAEEAPKKRDEGRNSSKAETTQLETYGHDLTRAALCGKIDPVVGRESEIERVAQILCRRKKNNPILIGEPGVGKSAIVEGLASKIAKKEVSKSLINKRIITLDLGSLVAGTKYRGQFEERIKSLLNEVKNNPDFILFIDEMHTLVGAGGSPGSLDAANLLKPALARGDIRCIGATTIDEYREIIEKDGGLERRFQKIMVEPTDYNQTLAILNAIKGKYEEFHNVKYSDKAIKACITLSQRYISNRCLPDKAIDVLDEAGSSLHLKEIGVSEELCQIESKIEPIRIKKREAALAGDFKTTYHLFNMENEFIRQGEEIKESTAFNGSEPAKEVTEEDIAKAVSLMSNIPVYKIAKSESVKLLNMENVLKGKIIGQDEAVSKVVKAIRRNRAGLKDPNKPIGSFLFLGPTGVGKTYLAKKIAEYMFDSADNIVRIDMSEYMEKFAVSRLIGAPPGYVGYNEGGQLSEQIRRKPYSVVLLDEVEKAHPEVFNILLQVLDEGRLTDSNGRYVDFKNTIVIMTSNIGSREVKEFGAGIGFSTSSQEIGRNTKNIIDKALSRSFAPEFINRLDEKIYFNSLSREDICKIIDIELKDLYDRISELGYNLTITEEAKQFVAEEGFDPKFGARPLKRAIQRYLEDPVSEMIIEDPEIKREFVVDLSPTKEGTVIS